jgi:hypothetical protein
MLGKTYSVFENAWFLNRTFTAEELRCAVSKLPHAVEVTQNCQGSSKNRLVLHRAEDFVFPRFLTRTLGGKLKGSWLYCGFELHTRSATALGLVRSLSQSFVNGCNAIDITKSVILEYLNIEIFFEDIPIFIRFNPFKVDFVEGNIYDGLVGFSVHALGHNTNHDHFGIDLRDSKGVGATVGQILKRFLDLFNDLGDNNELSAGGLDVQFKIPKTSVNEFVGRLINLAVKGSKILCKLEFIIPMLVEDDALLLFLEEIQNQHEIAERDGTPSLLSFFLRLHAKQTIGFHEHGEEYVHQVNETCQAGNANPNYIRLHALFLEEYVDWIASTAHMKTASGALPAYCLASDRFLNMSLVVFPVGDNFVLCFAPDEYQTKTRLPLKIASMLGSPDDWIQGVFPVEGDFILPALKDKHSYGFGEIAMPVPEPFAFQCPEVWVRRLKEEHRKKAKSRKSSTVPDPGSLDDQLAQLQAAGLVLSPGITALDFLLSHSEEFYREEPYVRVCQQLAKRNEEGVVFCPQTISHDEDYPSEEEMMAYFQRVCGKEYRIENIEYEFYPEDDEEGEGLKFIRFTANGENEEWFFGPDAAEERGRYSLLEYFQSFIKERMKDHRLYEIRGVWGTLIFLPKKAAKSMGKLIKLTEAPERD